MKNSDYNLNEISLQNAYDTLMKAYESTDTSQHDKDWELASEINDWNKRFNIVLNELRALKEEMIFTFKIEDDNEE